MALALVGLSFVALLIVYWRGASRRGGDLV
jgi:hypothetical protein